jgi:hypothetical protein
MKTPQQSILETLRRAAQSPRSQWLFILSLVTLAFASRHTLPLRLAGPHYDPLLEIVRSFASFYVAGLCAALARASFNNAVHVVAIGAMNGFFALAVSLLMIGGSIRATQLEVAFGALLAATATMLGAYAASKLSVKRR